MPFRSSSWSARRGSFFSFLRIQNAWSGLLLDRLDFNLLVETKLGFPLHPQKVRNFLQGGQQQPSGVARVSCPCGFPLECFSPLHVLSVVFAPLARVRAQVLRFRAHPSDLNSGLHRTLEVIAAEQSFERRLAEYEMTPGLARCFRVSGNPVRSDRRGGKQDISIIPHTPTVFAVWCQMGYFSWPGS